MTLLILCISFLILIFSGLPIAFSIGFASLLAAIIEGLPLTLLITKLFGGIDSFTILAVPYFILAGEIMNESGITNRIIELSNKLVGHLRGGLAHVNILASMFFAGISGSCIADSAGIGSVLIPRMISENYPDEFSVVVTATSSTIGPIIPPSLTMVLYGCLTEVSIGALFLGGLIPGILIGIGLMILSHIYCIKKGYGKLKKRASFKESIISFYKTSSALIMPLIIIGGIVLGIFTATEAGSIATIYALFLSFFMYKTLGFKKLWRILLKVAILTGNILFLIANANFLGHLLAREMVHEHIYNLLRTISNNQNVIIFLMVGIILILGMFIDTSAIVIMFAPTFTLVARELSLDSIHFGVVFCIAALIGAVTPPIGILLFIDCAIAKIPQQKIYNILWPFLFVLFFVCFFAAYCPNIVLFIPKLFYH